MSVTFEKTGNKVSAKVWNRTYTQESTPAILSSIVSCGDELLAAPITLNMISDGEKVQFKDAVNFRLHTTDGDTTMLSTFESDTVIVNIAQTFEEDGCDQVSLSIMPRGRTVAQVFGLEPDPVEKFAPSQVYMDVLLKEKAAEYYHVYPFGDLYGSHQFDGKDNNISFADFIPREGFHTNFKEQIYLCGDNYGLGFIFRDDNGWNVEDEKKAIEVIPNADGTVLLRFHLIDKTPLIWQVDKHEGAEPMDLAPITFKFGIIATPVKEFPKADFYERSFHVDCFKKIPTTENYDEYFAREVVPGSGENGYDRMARLGVKIVYLHEKWNDLQNSPELTDETLARAKRVIDECHKRGIKVIPYFGYEVSSLSSIFAKTGDLYAFKKAEYFKGYWYRYPYQRDLPVCMASDYADILYEGLVKLYDELGFDGLYFDSLVQPRPCTHTKHGCGYIGEDGEVHPTYGVWQVRKFLKKMYKFVKSRGGTINIHGFSASNLAAMYYCDSLWEGECFQSLLMKGELTEMPEGLMRAQFTGRNTGVPVYSLCYSNDPVWTFRNATSISLLHGSSPKPVDIASPLEDMSKIWDTFDSFPLAKAEFKPYWKQTERVTVTDDKIKVSVWETDDEMLIVCASVTADYKGTFTLKCDLPVLADMIEDGKEISTNGDVTFDFGGFDYKLIRAKKA